MKFFELKMRLIAPLVVMCCLIGTGSQVAQAQAPTSGALLTINGMVGTTPVNLSVSDKDIHSGVFNTVAVGGLGNCTAADQISTDAYVLQGGSPTGCDPGDAFEVTDNNTSGSVHQQPGMFDFIMSGAYSFHIETHYICSGGCSGFPAATFVATCNTSGTICTSAGGPDTGFLTVTNNSASGFTGTITLSGTSPTAGPPFCPVKGMASDSASFFNIDPPLGTGQSVTLALGSQGTAAAPSPSDSSNCGGFSSMTPQESVSPGTTTTFVYPGVMDQSDQHPVGTDMGGAAFMSVTFMNTAQSVCDSILAASATNGPNTWTGGSAVAAGSTCTIINGTGTTPANDTPVVTLNQCYDSSHNLLPPPTGSLDSCNITAPSFATRGAAQIILTSHYQTESGTMQPNPEYFMCSDTISDCANITTDPTCCTISGGTNRTNSRETIGSGPFKVCLLYPATGAVKQGADFPIKMFLCDANGIDFSSSSIVVQATQLLFISGNSSGSLMITDAGNSNPDNDFRFDSTLGMSGGYIFNFQTKGLAKNSVYSLVFTVNGISSPNYAVPLATK